jgi:hypothetical protein
MGKCFSRFRTLLTICGLGCFVHISAARAASYASSGNASAEGAGSEYQQDGRYGYSSSLLPSQQFLGPNYRVGFAPGLSYLTYQEQKEGYRTQLSPALQMDLVSRDPMQLTLNPALALEVSGMGLAYAVAGDLPGVMSMTMHAGLALPLSQEFGPWKSSLIIGYQGRYLGAISDDAIGYGDLLFPEFYFSLTTGPAMEQVLYFQLQPVFETVDFHLRSLPLLVRLDYQHKILASGWWLGARFEHLSIERIKTSEYRTFVSNEYALHLGCEI